MKTLITNYCIHIHDIRSTQQMSLSQDLSNEKGGHSSIEEEYQTDYTNDEADEVEYYELQS